MTSSDIYTKLYRLKNDTGITPTFLFNKFNSSSKLFSNLFNKLISLLYEISKYSFKELIMKLIIKKQQKHI